MWIMPDNYPLSFHYARDMVASSEDLTLLGLNIESSLMWRSKPSPLRTWLRRWKPNSYLPHLFTRILKPSQRTSFETKLALSLAVIRVPLLVPQAKGSVTKTPDTYGPTSKELSEQFDLLDASLKTSKDTSALDSEKSLATWKALVTERRGEYSVRVKSAHRTRESESTFWPTVTTDSEKSRTKKYAQGGMPLVAAVKWATPRVADSAGGPRTLNEKGQRVSVSDTTKTYGANLSDQVRHWPTPTSRDYKGGYTEDSLTRKDGKSRRFDVLPNAAIGGLGTDVVKGHLNPDWVEQLMGVPLGWTSLTGTTTQWTNRWADGSWEEGIPRVVESVADRVDRIRMLGNGVVPATAAKAWQVLTQRLCSGGVTCA